MALSKDEILNAVAELTVMELVDLIAAFEEKFGVSAAAVAVAAGPAAAAAPLPAFLPPATAGFAPPLALASSSARFRSACRCKSR